MATRPTTERPWVTAWTGGRRKLGRDPVLGPWVRAIGTIRLLDLTDDAPFVYLLRAICYQQLAGKAAATIHGRVVAALDHDITPGRVLRAPEGVLRAAGLSANKLAAVKDLATKASDGEVDLEDLDDVDDEEVVRRLTRVRGIGEWTAHMFLMFRLRRPDVWPVGDLGVRAGYAKAHALAEPPTARELAPLGDPYRPWRSAAAFYCWRVLETELA